MKILLLLLVLSISFAGKTQEIECIDFRFIPPPGRVFEMEWRDSIIALREPELHSGDGTKWFIKLRDSIKNLNSANDCENITVYVAVLVNENGLVEDFSIYRPAMVSEGCEKYILDLIENFPRLTPAKAIYADRVENVSYELLLPF